MTLVTMFFKKDKYPKMYHTKIFILEQQEVHNELDISKLITL